MEHAILSGMPDRTPLILAALHDLLSERVESPDDHHLMALTDGVALAVDHGEAARLWPPTGDDQGHALIVFEVMMGERERERVGRGGASAIVASARRLADVAASLLARGDVMRREAEALWAAASRLLGLDGGPMSVDQDIALAHHEADIHELQAAIQCHERLIADMTRMISDKDALIDVLRGDVAMLRKAAAEPPKVDLRPKSTGGPVRVRVTSWRGSAFAPTHVGQDGKVTAVDNNTGRWNILLDSGFDAWVPKDSVEVLP